MRIPSKQTRRGRPRKNVFGEYLETTATKTSQDLVTDIDNLTKDIFKNMENPQRISQILLELSVKNVGLGNYLIESLDTERTLETVYKWTIDKRKMELMQGNETKGLSATAAESQAKLECHTMLEELNISKKNVDILKIKRNDTDKVIDAARSRLSLIKQDMSNG